MIISADTLPLFMQDFQLIQQYLAWDERSLEILLKNHLQRIFWACFRVCKNEQDANDITQNVLLKIIKNLKNFQQVSSFSTWYYRIAYNESITFIKKKPWNQDIDEYAEIDRKSVV